MACSVLLSSEFVKEKMTFEKAKTLKTGMKSIRVGYDHDNTGEGNRFILQTAKMKIPFLPSRNDKFGDGKKLSINFSFRGEEESKRIQRFRKCIQNVSEAVVEKGVVCSEDWFGEEKSKEFVTDYYKTAIRSATNPTYSDTMRVGLPLKKDGTLMVEIFDSNEQALGLEDIEPGCEGVALLELRGLWCVGKQFGCSWKCVQLQLFKAQRLKGYQIKADPDDSDAEDTEESEVSCNESVGDD